MSLHINKFIDRVKSADAKQQKDITMSMSDAKNLHSDITKLLLALQELQNHQKRPDSALPSTIEITGGSF